MKKLLCYSLLLLSLTAISSCSDDDTPVDLPAPTITLSQSAASGMLGDEVSVIVTATAEAGIASFTVDGDVISSATGESSFTHTETYTIQNSDDVVTYTYVVTDKEEETATATLTINQGAFTLPTITLDNTTFDEDVAGTTVDVTGTVSAEAGIKSLVINGIEIGDVVDKISFNVSETFTRENTDDDLIFDVVVTDNVDMVATTTVTIAQRVFTAPTITLDNTTFAGDIAGTTVDVTGTVEAEAGIKTLVVNGVEEPDAVGLTSFIVSEMITRENTDENVTFDIILTDNVDEVVSQTVTVEQVFVAVPVVDLSITEFTGFANNIFTVDVTTTSSVNVTMTVDGVEVVLDNGSVTIEDIVGATDETVEIVVTDEIGQSVTTSYDVVVRAMNSYESKIVGNVWLAQGYSGNDGMWSLIDDNITLEIKTDLSLKFTKDGVVFMTANWHITENETIYSQTLDENITDDFFTLTQINIIDSSILNNYSYLQASKRRFNPNGSDTQLGIIDNVSVVMNRVDFIAQ